MKRFLITYTFRLGDDALDTWHRRIAEFIAEIEADTELRGKIAYRALKARNGAVYYHVAEAQNDAAIQALTQRDFFKKYSEETKRVGGGDVLVSPLDTIAETRSPPPLSMDGEREHG